MLDTSFSGRIIQVTEALAARDAVSNQVIELDNLFKELGLDTEVQSKYYEPDVALLRKDLDLSTISERDIVILHYYGYAEYTPTSVLDSYTTRITAFSTSNSY